LFTDIQGSYRQWERHPAAMPGALAVHDAILQRSVAANGGRIFKTIGDAVCAVFDEPLDGARAAIDAQRALFGTDWQALGIAQPMTVRMALQAGEAAERDGDFTGLVLNRISRLLSAGHGGQVLLTRAIAEAIEAHVIDGVEIRDLGERRLRDVPGANRIYQLEIAGLPNAFPPLETLDAIAHNLPVALNTCLDREIELAEIRRLLLDSPARLVTLLGPGGIGKTRLALHAATQVIDAFPGGIWFIDLSGIRDAALAPTAVASVLGVRIEPGIDIQRALSEAIGEREMLLLLDNCEQIVDGVARFIGGLLPTVPGLRVLATSRVPLELRGEQRIDIGPLPVELDEDAGPAVQLFIERARQIRPSFEMTGANQESIYDICRRVDGIPLALELAAARVAVLSPEALRTRLSSRLSLLTSTSRDLPERHQTLRAAIEWSYALLSHEEQAAFRALSVFQGGWSLAGAQAVTGLDDAATMQILGSLRDKSLVRLAETDDADPRYSMLETIQEYGMEQLTASAELGRVRVSHAAYFTGVSAEASQYVQGGPHQQGWLATIDREIANLRAAIQGSIDASDASTAIDLSINLWYYWSIRGLMEEGQRWLSEALTLATEVDQSLRARAMRMLGNLCVERGEVPAADSLYRASLAICRSIGDDMGTANSLSFLGMVSGMRGQHGEEYAFQIEALERCRALNVTRGIAVSLINLSIWALNQGKYDEALEFLDQVRVEQERLQDEIGLAFGLAYRAYVLRSLGELDEAADLFEAAEESLFCGEAFEGVSFARSGRAMVELQRGNAELAALLGDEALSGNRERGDKVAIAEALEVIGAISVEIGMPERGAESLGAASYLRELTDVPTPRHFVDLIDSARVALQAVLGPRGFAKHWENGRQREKRSAWLLIAPPGLLGLTGAMAS
jgi:predicted ATPase/class 3 adenylate cyclase